MIARVLVYELLHTGDALSRPRSMIDENDIVNDIFNYLCQNPDAADTLEGILQWWLNFDATGMNAGDVALTQHTLERVLESLCNRHQLSSRLLPGGRKIYFLPISTGS